jgi:hypothetical protein
VLTGAQFARKFRRQITRETISTNAIRDRKQN